MSEGSGMLGNACHAEALDADAREAKTRSNNKTMRIKMGGIGFLVVDLTEPLREDAEVYPGDPKPEKTTFCTFESHGCQHHVYSVSDHCFHPHGDAPKHHNPEYKDRGYDYWGLKHVFNSACMIDLTELGDTEVINGMPIHRCITAEHILPFMDRIKTNQAVIFRTGYDRMLMENAEHVPANIPYFDDSAVDVIQAIKTLQVIGTDSLTVDSMGRNYAHRMLKDLFIVECLVNLEAIPALHRSAFYLQTSPIAIRGATGGPVLAYAYIPEDG